MSTAAVARRANGRRGARITRERGKGWHAENRRVEPDPPSAWETILKELGIPAQHAVEAVLQQSPEGERLKAFVEHNFTRVYIPEDVLGAMRLIGSLEQSLDKKFPLQDRTVRSSVTAAATVNGRERHGA